MNPNPLLALNHFTVPCSLTDVLTFLLSYLCFSTASSRTTKRAASVNLQPLQSNLKVLQEQQTQAKDIMLYRAGLVNCSLAQFVNYGDKTENSAAFPRERRRRRSKNKMAGRESDYSRFSLRP